MFIATETPGRHPSSVRSGMFGGQRAASAIVPMFQAMLLLPELVSVKDGLNYRHDAPDGAFAGFSPPRAAGFGLPASFGLLPAPFRLDPGELGSDPAGPGMPPAARSAAKSRHGGLPPVYLKESCQRVVPSETAFFSSPAG